MNATARFARGTLWASVDNWSAQLAQLLTFVWAGNIVGPSVVGVMSLLLIALALAQHILVESLSEPLVQRLQIEPRHVATGFWSLFLLGAAALLAAWALARPVALLFGQPVIEDALRALALCFPLLGPSSILQAVLQRDLRFGALAARSLAVYAVASPACIAMAYAGFGVWSLVLYQLLIRVMDFVALAVALRRLPRPGFSRRHFDDIWIYGRHILKYRLVDFVSINLERVIIGYFLGPTVLGLFSLARRIVDSVQWALSGVLNSVALALLSRSQEDRAALSTLLRRIAQFAALVVIPGFVGLAAIAPFLIEALLRPEWLPMVPLVQILCLYGLVQADVYFSATVLRALGRIDLVYRVGLFVVAAKLVGFLVAVRFGSLAIAWTMVVVHAAAAPTLFGMVCAQVPDAGAGRLRAYGLPALAAAVMALAVLVAGRELAALPAPTQLALVTAGGFLVYWLALGILQPRAALTTMAWLAQRLSLRRM